MPTLELAQEWMRQVGEFGEFDESQPPRQAGSADGDTQLQRLQIECFGDGWNDGPPFDASRQTVIAKPTDATIGAAPS
ncbi:hypothetical protein GCM10009563_27680 [Subtercola frigoramans]